ncbi:putative coiled-coil domain-containing protein 195 [Elephas maximus indicus]|uniref:putative coiled-coil domain-containing protein 195 n=1 Tax=Elephas maximus indicus TaxID=99487 RepID=UPI00211702A5|nr:putative coiled-coil domain-containing protein 195 [Elephas maximus indicus]
MEANIQLMQVIQETQAEINKLEKDNRALRMKLTSSNQRPLGSEEESEDAREEEATDLGNLGEVPAQSSATLPGSISTVSAPASREPQGNVMIIRRYSISSSVNSFAAIDPWKTGKRLPSTGILKPQGTFKSLVSSSVKKQDNEEKMFAADSCTSHSFSQRALPEHIFGCRDKIKTISFLLPMDISAYSKNSSFLKYSPSQTTNKLSTIME